MSADACPVCNEAYLRVSAGDVKWWDRPCRHKYAGPCEHAERLAISRAAEIERLKADLAKYQELHQAAQSRADLYETARDELADQLAELIQKTNQEPRT